jgi:hypothetical protein
MADQVAPPEFVAHVRAVTGELRELIPTVALIAGRARALFGADVFADVADDRARVRQMHAAGVCDLAEVAELLAALLNLNQPPPGTVLVDLMGHLDRHAGR